MITIYILVDPRDRRVRYVGQTCDPVARLRSHVSPSSEATPEKHAWVDSLRRDGMAPIMIQIGSVPGMCAANEGEKIAIDFYRESGAALLNCTTVGRKPLATEDKSINSGVRLSPEWVERLDALRAVRP